MPSQPITDRRSHSDQSSIYKFTFFLTLGLGAPTNALRWGVGPPKHRFALGLGSVWATVSYLLQEAVAISECIGRGCYNPLVSELPCRHQHEWLMHTSSPDPIN